MVVIRKQFKKLTPEVEQIINEFNIELDGYYCLFCKIRYPNEEERWKFNHQTENLKATNHHLNSNKNDNRPINLCKAHLGCNDRDRTDLDFEIISHDILNRNYKRQQEGKYDEVNDQIKRVFEAKEREINERTHPERVSNRLYFQIAEEELAEKTNNFGVIDYKTVLLNIQLQHYQDSGGRSEGGGASEKPARQAIDTLCSDRGEYEIYKEKTVRMIRRRDHK